jgi:dTDP-4-dehydrorhamnose 3,5-epimerase
MRVKMGEIAGVVISRLAKHGDQRGYVYELYNRSRPVVSPDERFVQDNVTFSRQVGTIRGLHYQWPPMDQGKLVTVLHGMILDVAVDLRAGSPTYLKWASIELSADNLAQVFLPSGLAHGFCTLAPDTLVVYKMTVPYSQSHERGIAWNDASLGIDWPVTPDKAILSAKDRVNPPLSAIETPFLYRNETTLDVRTLDPEQAG